MRELLSRLTVDSTNILEIRDDLTVEYPIDANMRTEWDVLFEYAGVRGCARYIIMRLKQKYLKVILDGGSIDDVFSLALEDRQLEIFKKKSNNIQYGVYKI